MAILTPQDKEKVKRAIPKASNKVIDATVARLYIAYPDPTKWTYTGLSGSVALVDDLVGHTFFLKLVDIVGSQGVLWDQELYVDFNYSQDRKFFHTFETEECLMGLLFEDTSDAAHFYKRVTTRQKHASKQTANNKNAVALKERLLPAEKVQGSRGEYVDVNTNQRLRRARGVLYYDDQPPPEWRSLYAELAAAGISEDMIAENREFIKDYISKQGGPLVGLEPPIPRKFSQRQAHLEPSPPVSAAPSTAHKKKKAPPPPPPPAATSVFLSPADTPSPSPTPAPQAPPAPPQASHAPHAPPQAPSLAPLAPLLGSPAHLTPDSRSSSEDATPAPAAAKPKFRLPPSNAAIPQVSHTSLPPPTAAQDRPLPTPPAQYGQAQYGLGQPQPGPAQPQYGQYGQPAQSLPARQGPPPPPRGARPGPPPPPRAGSGAGTGMASPGPPLPPQRTGAPPPPPPRASRGPAPPPPPSRSRPTPAPPQAQQVPQVQQYGQPATQQQYGQQQYGQPVPQQAPQLPQLPHAPQTPQAPQAPQVQYQPPPPPQREYVAPPPPQRTTAATPAVQHTTSAPSADLVPAQTSGAPPPPPLPPSGGSGAPPPPPMANLNLGQTGSGAPPPPPPPPDLTATSGAAPALPQPDAGRDALLASIRGVGGIGALRKTDKSQLEKPSVLLLEARGEPAPATGGGNGGAPAAPGQPESLADALASALNKRKDKVAASDDEDDDDW